MYKAQPQREKWVEVVEEYERSGLTQAEFVARRGVALSTLQSKLRRSRAQRTGPVRLPREGVKGFDTRDSSHGMRLGLPPSRQVFPRT
jgi:hypothetical protein